MKYAYVETYISHMGSSISLVLSSYQNSNFFDIQEPESVSESASELESEMLA